MEFAHVLVPSENRAGLDRPGTSLALTRSRGVLVGNFRDLSCEIGFQSKSVSCVGGRMCSDCSDEIGWQNPGVNRGHAAKVTRVAAKCTNPLTAQRSFVYFNSPFARHELDIETVVSEESAENIRAGIMPEHKSIIGRWLGNLS